MAKPAAWLVLDKYQVVAVRSTMKEAEARAQELANEGMDARFIGPCQFDQDVDYDKEHVVGPYYGEIDEYVSLKGMRQ